VFEIHDRAFGSTSDGPAQEAVLVDLLRQDTEAWLPRLSLVAESDGQPVGHVVCTRGLLRGEVPVLGLGPIGVLPEHQRTGIGTALVHAACAGADALDEPLVILLGDPKYYSRMDFVMAEKLGITPPLPHWAGGFQARPLTTFDPAIHHGGFRYAPAFEVIPDRPGQ
jgi:putative acetyltransferase